MPTAARDRRLAMMYTIGMAGDAFPILGRDMDNNWLLVRFTERIDCWMGRATGISNVETWNLAYSRRSTAADCNISVFLLYKDARTCMTVRGYTLSPIFTGVIREDRLGK